MWGDPTRFVKSQLTTSPVNQLEVLIERHEQAATIGKPTISAKVAGLLARRFERNWSQPAGFEAVFDLHVPSSRGGGGFSNLTICDSIVETCEFTGLWRLSNRGADGIEIDVGQTGRDGGFVEQRLSFEAGFPEMPSDVVFAVGTLGDGFGNTFHEPRNTGKPPTPVGKTGSVVFNVIQLF